MALTKVSRGLLSTGIVDNSTTTAITIDSSENVGIGTSSTYNMRTTIAGAGSALTTGTGSYAVASIYDTATAAAGTGGGLAFQGDDGTNLAVTFATVNGSKENATSGNYASYLGFSTRANGGNLTEKMRIDSAGSVNIIGSVSGTEQFRVGNSTGGTDFGITVTENDGVLLNAAEGATSRHMKFATGGTERMRIDASGNVKIGDSATDITSKLVVSGNASADVATFMYDGSAGTYLDIDCGAANGDVTIAADARSGAYPPLIFKTAATERMRIAADGSITMPDVYNDTTAAAANMHISSAGGLLFRSTSSARYKNTITDATHGLTELLTLRSVTYKGNNDGDTVFGGLIAEEVHDAGLTEFVQYNDEDEPDALAYGNMVSLCIKAIQELKEELNTATARITELENN